MEKVFVIQTNDKKFNEVISFFLSKYCDDKGVNVAIHEMTSIGGKKVMSVVKEK